MVTKKQLRKRKHKRSFSFISLAEIILFFSALLWLASCLFLRQYNNSLSTQTQSIQSQITALERQNESMKVEIAQLTASERVDAIVAGSGMAVDQNNIISIGSAGEGE